MESVALLIVPLLLLLKSGLFKTAFVSVKLGTNLELFPSWPLGGAAPGEATGDFWHSEFAGAILVPGSASSTRDQGWFICSFSKFILVAFDPLSLHERTTSLLPLDGDLVH